MNKNPPRKVKRRDASKHQWLHQLGKYEIIAIEFLCTEGEALTNNNTYWQRNHENIWKRNHNYNGHRKMCTNLIYDIAQDSLNMQKRLKLLPNAFSLNEVSESSDPKQLARDYASKVSAYFDGGSGIDIRIMNNVGKPVKAPDQNDANIASGSVPRSKTTPPPAPPPRSESQGQRGRDPEVQSQASSRVSSKDSTCDRSGRQNKRHRTGSATGNRHEEKGSHSYSGYQGNEWESSRGSYQNNAWWNNSWKSQR